MRGSTASREGGSCGAPSFVAAADALMVLCGFGLTDAESAVVEQRLVGCGERHGGVLESNVRVEVRFCEVIDVRGYGGAESLFELGSGVDFAHGGLVAGRALGSADLTARLPLGAKKPSMGGLGRAHGSTNGGHSYRNAHDSSTPHPQRKPRFSASTLIGWTRQRAYGTRPAVPLGLHTPLARVLCRRQATPHKRPRCVFANPRSRLL